MLIVHNIKPQMYLYVLSLFFMSVFIGSNAQNPMKDQKILLKGLSIASHTKKIILTNGTHISQTRGALNEEYKCYLDKGEYCLLWESDSAEFFFCKEAYFKCEDTYIGGIIKLKNKQVYYPWVYPGGALKIKETKEELNTEKFLSKIKKPGQAKPFIHTYYTIKSDIIATTE